MDISKCFWSLNQAVSSNKDVTHVLLTFAGFLFSVTTTMKVFFCRIYMGNLR